MRSPDRRRFFRVPLSRDIRVTERGLPVCNCRLREISLGNALLAMPDATSVSLPAELHLELEVFTPRCALHVEVEVEVVRVDTRGVAVRFVEMDLESLNDLHMLILMHFDGRHLLKDEFLGVSCPGFSQHDLPARAGLVC